MSVHQHVSDGNAPADDIRDAAWNAVAVASIAYQEERGRLRYMVDLAHRHGLTVPELAEASGFNEDRVLELLAEVA